MSSEEIKRIVEASEQPFKTHRDVAQEFQITVRLVHVLVNEGKKQPEKLLDQESRELESARKR